MTFTQSLDCLAGFRRQVCLLPLRELARALFNQSPLMNTLLEGLFLKDNFFAYDAYRRAIEAGPVHSFVDLGCNVGWFAAQLRRKTGRTDLRGLMIDANPELVGQAHRSVRANKLNDVRVLHGLVGAEKAAMLGYFYVLPSNLGSTQFPIYKPGQPTKGDWRRILVPRLSLESTWKKYFGDERCNLLKVNIEGSEKIFFSTDAAFLRRVDRIILEWHKWMVERGELDRTLETRGFELVEVFDENKTEGIAWYESRSAALRSNDKLQTTHKDTYERHD